MDCAREHEQDRNDNNAAAAPASDPAVQHRNNCGSTPPTPTCSDGTRKWRWYESRQLWLELRILAMGVVLAAIVISFMPHTPMTPATTTGSQPAPAPTLAAAHIAVDQQSSASSRSSVHESCWCPCRGKDGKMVKGNIVPWGYQGYCVCRCPLEVPAERQATDAFLASATATYLLLLLPVIAVLMCKYDFHL